MAKFLSVINGIPYMVAESAGITIYDETTELASSLSAGTAISLPSAKTFTGDELEVYLSGVRVDIDRDFTKTSSTQIQFAYDLPIGTLIRFRIDRGA